jgi:GTP pyrophosphokinase
MKIMLRPSQLRTIDRIVEHYEQNLAKFDTLVKIVDVLVRGSPTLMEQVHTVKFRVKNPAHLRDKLIRRASSAEASRTAFGITKENLFSKINDLAGYRILHLHTRQFQGINSELGELLRQQKYTIVEGPIAKVWDDESRELFSEMGIDTEDSDTMYTSVHYVIKTNETETATCEIQVRTLLEEVWGEVDHSINYPHQSDSSACRSQIRVLARMTSGCSRLVDSIFSSHREHVSQRISANKRRRRRSS